eukprot:TRINITY_DN8611_c0_g2_i5.p1 TRINITY_DN8611_c0_g2~~TRINITY_DN8611_c0_g2_i5.p1  ORF type:complete len:139 (+),score=31.19 TRINITY_DN8611_c0_g2_i5:404-820(+)
MGDYHDANMNIEVQEQHPETSINTVVSEISSLDGVYQRVQATQKETGDQNIEDLEVICKSIELLIKESIASTLPKQSAKASKEQAIDQEIANENQVIEVPRIDFIFGDRSLMHGDCVQPVEIQKSRHQMVTSHSKASS